MATVCSVCGDTIKEGFFSSADRCKECRKYVCDDCSKDDGQGIYCPECFKEIKG